MFIEYFNLIKTKLNYFYFFKHNDNLLFLIVIQSLIYLFFIYLTILHVLNAYVIFVFLHLKIII